MREPIIPYPKISIITPNYNGVKYLEETINSVISQKYPNLEYIIIDGGSTDDSIEIIKKFEKDIFYFVSEKDNGMYDAINKGFSLSTGEIMTYINSDDILMPKSLFAIAQMFSDLEEVDWVQGRSITINHKSFITSPGHLSRSSVFDYMDEKSKWIGQDGTFWRRTLWKKIGSKINSKYKFAGDFELFSHFFLYKKLYSTNSIFSAIRFHKNQLHVNFFDQYIDEVKEIIKDRNYPKKLVQKQKKINFINTFLMKIPGLRNTEYIKKTILKLYETTPLIIYDEHLDKYRISNGS